MHDLILIYFFLFLNYAFFSLSIFTLNLHIKTPNVKKNFLNLLTEIATLKVRENFELTLTNGKI